MTLFHSQTINNKISLSHCTSNCFIDFNYKVLPDLYGSDQFPVLLESSDSASQSRPSRWRLDKADWHLFKDLNTPNRSMDEIVNCDKAATYFNDVLHSHFLNVLFHGGRRIVELLFKKSVPPFLAFWVPSTALWGRPLFGSFSTSAYLFSPHLKEV